MPLRPATFAPYPAPDKRAAARERYLRALEEARKAKEAYADMLSDGEDTKKDAETEQPDHPSSSAPATTTETADSNTTTSEQHKSPEEPMAVDQEDPVPTTRPDSPLAQPEPLLRQPTPVVAAVPTPSEPQSNPAPTSAADESCEAAHKGCHLTSWLRASMGIPSMFASFPKTSTPVESLPRRIETTMPAPIPGPPPTTAPAPSDKRDLDDCAHRRRAALNVATLSEQQPTGDLKASPFARTDSSASSSSRGDTYSRDGAARRRHDEGFRATADDHRSQPSPSSSSSSHHGFPPVTAAAASSSARDGYHDHRLARADIYRRPEFPPTQLAPLPPPRSRSDSTSDDGTGTVLPPLRETSGWRYGQEHAARDERPSRLADKYALDEHQSSSPAALRPSTSVERQLPSLVRSSASSHSHLPLLAAAAATVEANSMYRGSDSAACLKRHERDWDCERDQEDARRSRDRPWEASGLVSKGGNGHKRDAGDQLLSAAYPARKSDGSPRRDGPSTSRPLAPAPHGLADLPRAFAALTSGSPSSAFAPTSLKYPIDLVRLGMVPGRGESVMPEPISGTADSEERVMPSPIEDVPMREERGRSRSRSPHSAASTLTASSAPRVSPAARSKGKERAGSAVPVPSTTTPKLPSLPGLAGLAPLPPLARALPQLPLPAPKPRPPSPTPQRIPLFFCEESTACATSQCASADEPDAASADALSEISRLNTSLESLKRAFAFPNAEQLDFGTAAWPAGFAAASAGGTEGPRVRLPVTARNLTVHAYEHALHKLLSRLEAVGSARVRGVRDARKKVVGAVKDDLQRLDDHVQVAARAWLARNPDVSLP
ncbi:hypothetical protein BKA62DRAFT_709899 [Auriculariales sp. MPI-PUGE-AT-0066]|nr:hypothetical protein BKA62DRAFT_709899 [Auriculariales sp. MPI-PUGE-AT-0066]